MHNMASPLLDGEFALEISAFQETLTASIPALGNSRTLDENRTPWEENDFGILVLLGHRLGRRAGSRVSSLAAALACTGWAATLHQSLEEDTASMPSQSFSQAYRGQTLRGDALLAHAIELLSREHPDNLFLILDTLEGVLEAEIDKRQQRFSFDVTLEAYLQRLRSGIPRLKGLALSVGGQLGGLGEPSQKILWDYGLWMGVLQNLDEEIRAFRLGRWLQPFCLNGFPGLLMILYMEQQQYTRDKRQELAHRVKNAAFKDLTPLLGEMKKHRILRKAEELVGSYRTEALKILKDFHPHTDREILATMIRPTDTGRYKM